MNTRSLVAALALVAMQVQVQSKSLASDETCSEPKSKRGSAMLQSPSVNGNSSSLPDVSSEEANTIGQQGPLVVPLDRIAMRTFDNELGTNVKSFYIGNITMGHPPQRLQVLFDTSSGNVLVPHRVCRNRTCQEHRRYSSQKSLTSQDVDFSGNRVQKQHRLAIGRCWRDSVITEWTSGDLGTGNSKAVLVKDKMCLKGNDGQMVCAWPAINAGISMDEVPFRAMPGDGIVGLGLGSLAATPLCSFFGTLVENTPGLLPQFGMSFGLAGGELYIGGFDSSNFAAPLQWFPVHSPEDGFWQVPILEVRLGNVTVDACDKGCHAMVDTSAARLGVQQSHLPKLHTALASSLTADGTCQGPELEFVLEGLSVKIGPEDYTGASCVPELGPLDLQEPDFFGVYAFGESVLRHYFVAFDWKDKLVGFAPTKTGNYHGAATKVNEIVM